METFFFSGGGGGGYGHATFDASNGHPRHKSKGGSSAALNALTLLAFLFFINILQNCLKEQMHSSNPTVLLNIYFLCNNNVFK